MDIKTILKKYLVFVFGLYFLAAGIVLIIHSALGTTPISSVNYVLSLNSPLSLGTCTFIVNVLLILGQFWFCLLYTSPSPRDRTRTVLVNPRDEKPSRPNIYPVANSIFVHIFNIHRFQYVTR